MNFGELLWWYLGNARDYAAQMLPCMCAGMAVYALALPVRRRRLDRLGLVSPRRRELALLLFVMFAAGLAALEQCPDWPEKARTLLASERPALSDGLTALGLEVVPGQANYLLFRAAGAADLKERMLMRGVLIRSCANYHGLGNDWYRVCVGQAEQNRRLLAALKEVL